LLDRDLAASADVLNGIAVMEKTGTLLVTGKLWPNLYEAEVVSVTKDDVK
jgi:glutamine cyclotransferase